MISADHWNSVPQCRTPTPREQSSPGAGSISTRKVSNSGTGRQVHEWIEVERRSAVALALTAVRARLRDTQQRVLSLVAELEGETHTPPRDREQRIHSLAVEVRRLPEWLAEDAHALVATTHSHATDDD